MFTTFLEKWQQSFIVFFTDLGYYFIYLNYIWKDIYGIMIKEITSTEFKETLAATDKLFLVDFFTEWCSQSKAMSPVISQILMEYKKDVTINRLNIEKYPDIALEYRVLSIPTILVFKNGSLAGRIEGVVTKAAIEQKLKKYLS